MNGVTNVYARDEKGIVTVMTLYYDNKTGKVKGTLGESNPFDFPIEPGMDITEVVDKINLVEGYSTDIQKLLFT